MARTSDGDAASLVNVQKRLLPVGTGGALVLSGDELALHTPDQTLFHGQVREVGVRAVRTGRFALRTPEGSWTLFGYAVSGGRVPAKIRTLAASYDIALTASRTCST